MEILVELWGVKASKAPELRRRAYLIREKRGMGGTHEHTPSQATYNEVVRLGECYRLDIEKPSSSRLNLSTGTSCFGHGTIWELSPTFVAVLLCA